jgi:hypothetical protein
MTFCSKTVRTSVKLDLVLSHRGPIRNAFQSLFTLKRRIVSPSGVAGSIAVTPRSRARSSRISTGVGSHRVCRVRWRH